MVDFSFLADSEASKASTHGSHVYLGILLSLVAVMLALSGFIFLLYRKRRKHVQSEPSAGLECSPSCFTFLSSSNHSGSFLGLYSSSKGLFHSLVLFFIFLYWKRENLSCNVSLRLRHLLLFYFPNICLIITEIWFLNFT